MANTTITLEVREKNEESAVVCKEFDVTIQIRNIKTHQTEPVINTVSESVKNLIDKINHQD